MKLTRSALSWGAATATLARPAILNRRRARSSSAAFPANSVHWIACAAVERGFFQECRLRCRDRGDPELAAIHADADHRRLSNLQHAARRRRVAAIERGAGKLAADRGADETAPTGCWAGATRDQEACKDLKGKIIGVSSLRIQRGVADHAAAGAGRAEEGRVQLHRGRHPRRSKSPRCRRDRSRPAVLFPPLRPIWRSRRAFADLGALQRHARLPDRPLYGQPGTGPRRAMPASAAAQAYSRSSSLAVGSRRNRDAAIEILAKYTKRERTICAAVYGRLFSFGEKTYFQDRRDFRSPGLKNLLDDVAEDGDIFQAAGATGREIRAG